MKDSTTLIILNSALCTHHFFYGKINRALPADDTEGGGRALHGAVLVSGGRRVQDARRLGRQGGVGRGRARRVGGESRGRHAARRREPTRRVVRRNGLLPPTRNHLQ